MEFHISRTIREKLEIDGLLFSYTGNVVFANVATSRKLANRLNESRGANPDPSRQAATAGVTAAPTGIGGNNVVAGLECDDSVTVRRDDTVESMRSTSDKQAVPT